MAVSPANGALNISQFFINNSLFSKIQWRPGLLRMESQTPLNFCITVIKSADMHDINVVTSGAPFAGKLDATAFSASTVIVTKTEDGQGSIRRST